jgi:acrosin
MMSTDYLLNGNQLTQIINGTSQSPTTVNINNVQIAATGNDNVTVENFAGAVTINGGGGGDTITVYGGAGGSVRVTDPSASTLDQLIVRAPTTSADNFSASSGSVSLTSGDSISWSSGVGSVSMVGQLFSNGDSLAITGSGGQTIAIGASSVALGGSAPTLYYSTFNGITVNGGASDSFTLSGDSIPTTLNAGSGNDSFTINTNSVALSLNGGSGNDTYTINSNSGLLTATGGSGNSSFIVNASSSSMTLNGGASTNSFTVQSNSATLNLNGGGTTNTVVINGNSSTLIARGGTGSADSYTVNATTGGITLAGGTGSSAYTITAPTVAAVTVTGSTTGTGTLTYNGTTLNNAFSVSTNAVSAGSGAAVGFTHLTGLVVNGIGGNDSFLVGSDSTPTTLNGSTGNDTFNIQATSAALAINTGSGNSTVNLGSNAPQSASNTVAGLTGAITVIGDGSDTLNFNDAADIAARTATLTGTSLTGLGTGGLSYSGLAALNLKLGSGGNTLAIRGTAVSTVTNFNTGAGSNTLYLGSTNAISLGGLMDNYLGNLNLTGSGSDTLVVDDSGNTNSKTVALSGTRITGISTGQINYAGISAMSLDLGTAGNSITVSNTSSTTATTINGGAGNDTFTIAADSDLLHVSTGGGADTVNVQTIAAATTVNSSGNSQINLGTTAPATGGVLSGIAAAFTLTGAGTDTLTADDGGDTLASTGTLSATALHGLGLASAGVTYSGLAGFNLNLGSATNTLTITNTAANTATRVTGGTASDNITLQNDAGLTTILSGAGNDQINVQGINAATSITTGAGTDTVNVGSNAPATPSATASVAATLTVNGGGNTQLNIDDTGDNTARTPTLTSNALTGISGGSGIAYTGLAGLAVSLGSGGNNVQVASTATNASTTLNSGSGNDTVSVLADAGTTTINTGGGTNTVNVGSTSLPSGILTGIAATLTVNGNSTGGNDSINLVDASDANPRIVTLNQASLTGASPATINFNNFGLTSLYTGTANNQITVTNTHAGITVIAAGTSSNTIALQQISGPTTLQAGNSTIALQNAAAATTLSATAPNQITIGNPVTGGRTLAGINAAVQLTGVSGSSALVDDSADTIARTASINAGGITGLSIGAIGYSGLAQLGVLLGSGGNTVTISNTTSNTPTTITGGAGNDVLNVQADSAPLTVAPAAGANTVNLGNSGLLAGLVSPVTVTSTGNDTLNVIDGADTTARTTASLDSNSITGLGAASIGYSGVKNLNLSLGNAADTLNITGTASGTQSAVHTGAAGTAVNIRATTGPLSIQSGAADTVNIGSNGASAGLLNTINAPVSVTGNDTLNINDNADTSNVSAALTATGLTGFGATAAINYSGLSLLNINLGTGNDVITVNGTAAGSTAVNSGGGNNAITIHATTAPLVINGGGTVQLGDGNVTSIIGAVTLAGTGSDQLLLDDSSDTINQIGTMSATQLALGPALVSYSGTASAAIQLGAGTDLFTINSTAAATPVTLTGGTGEDTLKITGISSPTTVNSGSNAATTLNVGNALLALGSPLTLIGNGSTTLNINDTASTTTKTGTLGGTALTGLGANGINFSGIAQLNLSLGSGGNTFAVAGDTTPTTVTAGSANDALAIDSFTAPVTVIGGGTAELVLDDSADTSARAVAITGSTVTGLGTSGVTYSSLASLNVVLGSGGDAVAVNGTGGATSTTVTGNGVGQTFLVAPAGGVLQSPLALEGAGTDPLTINDTPNLSAASITLGNGEVDGFGGIINYTGITTLAVNLAAGNDTATITAMDPAVITSIDGGAGENIANINLAGDLSGKLTLTHFSSGSVDVAGNFTGSLRTDGGFSTVHVDGNFTPTAVLGVTGVLGQLEVDGADAGQLTVGSLQGVVEPSVIPSADGTIFSLSSGGVTRSIQVQMTDPSASLSGTTFSVVYDATTGVPQAAVRVNGGTDGERFDVVLNAPITSSFSLSGLYSSNGLTRDVRNVVADGSILTALTTAQSAYFNTGASGGGVQLPADALGSVAARDVLQQRSIWAKSIQGLAFSDLTGSTGELHPGGLIPVSDFKEKLLLSALMLNPGTNKAYAAVAAPTETLLAAAGTAAEKTGLFAGSAYGLPFDPNGIVVWNRDGSGDVTAAITFSDKRINREQTVSTLAFAGAGGSVQTRRIISAISSDAAIGDVYLFAGKAEQLQGITAPTIEGTINLFGGKLIGTIQTTALAGGDIGSADGSSTIALQMGSKARIVSRGNLFSEVAISGNLTGTIAASGDIKGSVTVTGPGRSTGDIIAFGAIDGPVSVAGSFSGEMAAGGSSGIRGNVMIRKGILRGGVVASAGEIGDTAAGTSLTTSSVLGTVSALGAERVSSPRSRIPVVQSIDSAALIEAIWNPAGQPVEIDDSPGDLLGLAHVEAGLKTLTPVASRPKG